MICPNCRAAISDEVRFCTNCGMPVTPPEFRIPMPQQPSPAPSPFSQPVPVSPAAAKTRKKLNPLVIILPAVAVVAAAAVVICIMLFSKPSFTLEDLEDALYDKDFKTAFEISEQLPEKDCEPVIEEYIIYQLSSGTDTPEQNDKTIQKMFSSGFDKYKTLYKNYKDGKYAPEQKPENDSTSSGPQIPDSGSESSLPETDYTSDSANEPAVTIPTSEAMTYEPTWETTEPETEEQPMFRKVIGRWRRSGRSAFPEYVEFYEDGTGVIYSEVVSENVSDTNPDYLYYDGKIHFTWVADSNNVFVTADIDPYCFVAYQGYAADGHKSFATWKGSKNGSHDYYFSYNTEEEYLCDMLGINSSDSIDTFPSLTRDYWDQCLDIFADTWDMYFHHYSDMDFSRYEVDYSTLADSYYSNAELRAKYEDVDLYHFVVFSKQMLLGSGYSTTVKLDFNMEDYERDD